MLTVNSDDFGSLIAFASQLIFVLHDNLIPSHDCLNPIEGVAKSQKQVTVYAHERTFLRSMIHCGSIMDSLPVSLSIIKAHRFCHVTKTQVMQLNSCQV